MVIRGWMANSSVCRDIGKRGQHHCWGGEGTMHVCVCGNRSWDRIGMRGASEVTGDVCRHQVLQLLHPLEQSSVLRLETTHRLLPTVNLPVSLTWGWCCCCVGHCVGGGASGA